MISTTSAGDPPDIGERRCSRYLAALAADTWRQRNPQMFVLLEK
jgi:hypothetical protein